MNADPVDPTGTGKPAASREWAVWLHLSLLLAFALPLIGWLAPVLIWKIRKDSDPGIIEHGRNAVNFLLSMLVFALVLPGGMMLIVWLVETAFSLRLPPWLVLFPWGVFAGLALVLPVVAAVKAARGTAWRYPSAISFYGPEPSAG